MNKSALYLMLLVLSISFTDCTRRRLLTADEPKGKVKIKKKFQAQQIDLPYLNCKSKIDYINGSENFTSNANIRIRKDSVIWVSINPTLGIEVVRCLINKDSVFIINKIQKEYYDFSFAELSEFLNFKVDYKTIESVLLGNLLYNESEEDSTYGDSLYTILQQTRNNIQLQNFMRNSNQKLERLNMTDEDTYNNLSIMYDDFLPIDQVLFPFNAKINLYYRNKKGLQTIFIGIQHNKIEVTNKDLKFPFHIPSKYTNRK